MQDLWENCCFVNSATDVYILNNYLWITKYQKQVIKIDKTKSNRISLERRKIQLWLILKNTFKGFILYFQNVYYPPKSFCNFISLGLLNDSNIYHNNENKTFYKGNKTQLPAKTNC